MVAPALARNAPGSLLRSGAVLCFHGVTGSGAPPEGLVHVPLDVFRMCVRVARSVAEIVPLSEVVERHHAGRSTAGLVALTFDDAYASVLEELGPFLAQHQVPATLFVVASAASTGQPFWWDRMDALLAQLPTAEWSALEDACGLPRRFRGRWPEFGRHWPLREWIVSRHRGRWTDALEKAFARFERQVPRRAVQRPMVWPELDRLTAMAPVDLGVHTVTHPVLPLLPAPDAIREIVASHHILREHSGRAVPILAAPFGLFDRRTVPLAREAGMKALLSLANTTLCNYPTGEEIPRFCIDRGETVVKLVLRLTGVLESFRYLRGTVQRYPFLPPAMGEEDAPHGLLQACNAGVAAEHAALPPAAKRSLP